MVGNFGGNKIIFSFKGVDILSKRIEKGYRF